MVSQVNYYLYFWVAISNLAKNEVRRRLDKNLHKFRPWTQGQINDLGFPEPESSDLSARASPPKFLIPTLRKPRRVGQPQLGGAKGGPARQRHAPQQSRTGAGCQTPTFSISMRKGSSVFS